MHESLRVMTYNIHSCVGTDGIADADRISNVIAAADPDVVALQEVDRATDGPMHGDQARYIADRTGMEAHFTCAHSRDYGDYGIATLLRHPFEVHAEGALPRINGEPRAAQWLRVSSRGVQFDVINTHLSLHFKERFSQLRAILQHDESSSPAVDVPTFPALPPSTTHVIFCGDFNAGVWSPEYRYLSSRLHDSQRHVRRWPRPTFPSRFPLLRLDHIWVGGGWQVSAAYVFQNHLSRLASDHLPLVADLAARRSIHS